MCGWERKPVSVCFVMRIIVYIFFFLFVSVFLRVCEYTFVSAHARTLVCVCEGERAAYIV